MFQVQTYYVPHASAPPSQTELEIRIQFCIYVSLQEAHLQQDMQQYKCINAENLNFESQTFEIYKDYDECSEFDINESPKHS